MICLMVMDNSTWSLPFCYLVSVGEEAIQVSVLIGVLIGVFWYSCKGQLLIPELYRTIHLSRLKCPKAVTTV